jgi:hypothetical protein
MTDHAKPTTEKGQKGQFVGDPAKTHIHIVKNNTHITVAGKRTNFTEDKKGYAKALAALEGANGGGVANCKAWLAAQ